MVWTFRTAFRAGFLGVVPLGRYGFETTIQLQQQCQTGLMGCVGPVVSMKAGSSDIIHRLVAFFGELFEVDAFELGAGVVRDVLPHLADGGTAFAFGVGADVEQGGFDGIDDFPEVDRFGVTGEQVASGLAAAAFDHAAASQIIEDLD